MKTETKYIVHVTTVHPRNDARILYKQCLSLSEAGYRVGLFVADGLGDSDFEGVKITDIGRRANRRLLRFTLTQLRMALRCFNDSAECYHLHDPELLPLGLFLRAIGRKVIYDMHEDVVRQIRIKSYLNPHVRKFISKTYDLIERFTLKRLSALVTASDLLCQSRIGYSRIVVSVPNYVDLSRFNSVQRDFRKVRVLHAGALTVPRGLLAMKELAVALDQKNLGIVNLIGAIGSGIQVEALAPCVYSGVVDFSEIPAYYNLANVGVILYQPIGQYGQATAVKLYEYMAAGIPVLLPDHGDWADLNKKLNVGICVDVESTKDQVAAIEFLMNNGNIASQFGVNGRRYVEKFANWEISKSILIGLYARVLASPL